MRIGINALGIRPGPGGGCEAYVRKLIQSIGQTDSNNEYVIFVTPVNHTLFDLSRPNFCVAMCAVPSSTIGRVLFEQLVLPWLVWREKIDVLHAPATYVPLLSLTPCVVTTHISPQVFHQARLPATALLTKIMQGLSAWRATRVICMSRSHCGEMIREYHLPSAKLVPIYHGVDALAFRPGLRDRHQGEALGIPERYLLMISSVNRHKNYTQLIQAYSLFRNLVPDAPDLVIIGKVLVPEYLSEIKGVISELGLEQEVLFIDGLPHESLPSVYAGALGYVYTSAAESFGITQIEAMASGIPVVTSNRGANPEIVRDAALCVDPDDIEALAQAMRRILEDQGLRQQLIERGLARSQEFTWERCARETIAVYEQIYNERRGADAYSDP